MFIKQSAIAKKTLSLYTFLDHGVHNFSYFDHTEVPKAKWKVREGANVNVIPLYAITYVWRKRESTRKGTTMRPKILEKHLIIQFYKVPFGTSSKNLSEFEQLSVPFRLHFIGSQCKTRASIRAVYFVRNLAMDVTEL